MAVDKYVDSAQLDSDLTDIADAIREKGSTESPLAFPDGFISAVEALPSGGGITPTGTKQIEITQNGTTTEDVTQYANAQITANVPNSYSAGDEGKVVSNGALVAQTSDTVTQNDTYDTTLINSLTVAVSGGGSSGLTVIDTITATAVRSVKIDVESSWFNTYDYVLIVPDLTFSVTDWLYFAVDATAGNAYSNKISSIDSLQPVFLCKPSAIQGSWFSRVVFSNANITSYLYFYMFTETVTMTGTFTIYGVKL